MTAQPVSIALPEPCRSRWQPLRVGLVELYYYDCEEFWFRDGHLLLRGNNGTGKSKVLSLTLPFLLDANLKPKVIAGVRRQHQVRIRNHAGTEALVCSCSSFIIRCGYVFLRRNSQRKS